LLAARSPDTPLFTGDPRVGERSMNDRCMAIVWLPCSAGSAAQLNFLMRNVPRWGTTALRAAHGKPQVGHSRRGEGVDHLQADLPAVDAVE
jgi:hypothetical protein